MTSEMAVNLAGLCVAAAFASPVHGCLTRSGGDEPVGKKYNSNNNEFQHPSPWNGCLIAGVTLLRLYISENQEVLESPWSCGAEDENFQTP
jgi:hypothetical protein